MLTTAELARPLQERGLRNHETYKHILGLCYAAIRASNERRLLFTRFLVPASVPGRPGFKLAHAVAYVRAKLLKGGFGVCEVPPHPHLLHIQWTPAAQARTPRPVRL